MNLRNKYLLISLLIALMQGIFVPSFGQVKLISQVIKSDSIKVKLPQGSYKSVEDAKQACERFILKMQLDGYASANLDSFASKESEVKASFFIGPKFVWQKLAKGNLSDLLLHELQFPKDSFEKSTFRASTFKDIAEKAIVFYENRGYPFTSVRLNNVSIEGNAISAELFLDKGRKFVMDSLDIVGDANIRKGFLYSYLGFKPGDLYNEELVTGMDERLRKLPFIQVKSASRVYFLFDKAHPVLNLGNRKTDRIDGIVGFAPNSDASDNNDLLLTGEVNIDLNNLMGSAKSFDLRWKSFTERSQELKVAANLPYIFRQSFGVDGFAEIYKYDTFTINVRSGLGVQYLFSGTDFLRFYYENSLSILQTIDTNQIRLNRSLPTTNPVTMNTYGLNLFLQRLDYNVNPRKGISLRANVGIGNKIIEKDSRIEAVQFVGDNNILYSIYDSVDLRIFTGRFEYDIAYFQPIAKKSALVPSIRGKHIVSDRIFFDELFRIGGNNDLRGFDEKAIQASSYHIYQLEYRYLLSRNSYFSGFVNGAYYQNMSEGNSVEDYPFGFGVGLNLEVTAGILQLAFALGQQQGNPIAFNQAKIHFGIISYL